MRVGLLISSVVDKAYGNAKRALVRRNVGAASHLDRGERLRVNSNWLFSIPGQANE